MQFHYYWAFPDNIDRYWTTPIELYTYLYYTPPERYRLLHEIRATYGNLHDAVAIYHPCSQEIVLLPHENDVVFRHQLFFLIHKEGEVLEEFTRKQCTS
jgi:hypothetical protein